MPITVRNQLRPWVPPAFRSAYHKLSRTPQELFAGHSELFIEALVGCAHYGEYGAGLSTIYVLEHTEASVVSIETDPTWVDNVRAEVGSDPRLAIKYQDVGPVGSFGTPLSFAHRSHFPEYARSLWRSHDNYDVILIDGRFRISCFAACYLHARAGTKIVFDDYVDRERYHVVEELLAPTTVGNRQALFTVPLVKNIDTAEEFLEEFKLVWL